MSKNKDMTLRNIKCHVDMTVTDRMRQHAYASVTEHPLDFQVFRLLTGYDEALEEIEELKAEVARKEYALDFYMKYSFDSRNIGIITKEVKKALAPKESLKE